LSKSRFDSFNSFLKKRRRLIIIAWVVAAIIAATLIPTFFSVVSYNVTNTNLGGPSNTPSQIAQNILNAQFPSNNRSDNSILIVVQGSNLYSSQMRNTLLGLNRTFAADNKIANYSGMSTVFSTEYGLLNSTVPSFVPQVSSLSSNISSIAQLIFGIPSGFVSFWEINYTSTGNATKANEYANATYFATVMSEGPESLGYYSVFYVAWNETFTTRPSISAPVRESLAINETVPQFSASLSPPTKQIVNAVATGLNINTFSSQEAIWNLSSRFFANATANSFSTSPLFTINSASFAELLSSLNGSNTSSVIQSAIYNATYVQSVKSYPYILSSALTKNFLSSKNDTMLVVYNFSFSPDRQSINSFRTDVQNSNLSTLGTPYVTGGNVLSQDISDAFGPALDITIGPGVAVSLLVVALLFFAPLAAIIPIVIGAISIGIALSSIYVGIVVVGHGTISFLTPTLTILLMLGLAVDYSVIQLRRTKEERKNGRSNEESVGVSVKWAGQAVLTAGITVIVAYVVMAVANVPLFSDVGTAIALGVSILLAASMTLLPALELTLGDKLFWPSFRNGKRIGKPQGHRLAKLAEKTLKRKALVAVVISLFALGAFYGSYRTPTGSDLLRLFPNFHSNQGLTVITNGLGSGDIGPTTILVTTASPIVYGNNQFNQTLLNEIESVSATVASSSGVLSVTSPTRPYGASFNYSSVSTLPEPEKTQYLSGMLAQIGKDNKTALILVGLTGSFESQAAINSLLAVESHVKNLALSNGVSVYFGGSTQSTYDSQSFLTGILPEVVIILAAAVYVILLIQLRSAFTPVRLVFTILCSVAFSLAVLSVTFYYILQLPILDFAPLFVVVTMLGVGIDYDIFFVTRIREEALTGSSDDQAIKTAITKVWVTIFGLGLVLSAVFASLLATGIALLQEIALSVAAAVLIDVSIVILFFVPSLMGIAQRFNWWPSRAIRSSQEQKPSSAEKK
jgi:putative drug exporter of the RND superfamily